MTTAVRAETDIVEDTLNDMRHVLHSRFRMYVGKAVSVETPEEDAVVRLHATIEKEGESPGVVRIGEYTAKDLYAYSDSARMRFWDAVATAKVEAEVLCGIDVNDVEFEVQGIRLWEGVTRLADYLGISPEHDELISVFLTIGDCLARRSVDDAKARGLYEALSLVASRVSVSADLLDAGGERLEQADFDLDEPMSFARSGVTVHPDVNRDVVREPSPST